MAAHAAKTRALTGSDIPATPGPAPIVVCDTLADAEAVSEAWGEIAVSWPGRRSSWHAADWSALGGGRRLVVLSACTDAARARSQALAAYLHGQGVAELRIGLPEGSDRTGPAEWIEAQGKAKAKAFIGRLLEPFEPPVKAPALRVDVDTTWADTNPHYRVLGAQEESAVIRLSNHRVTRVRADRLTTPAALIRLAPRTWWCAIAGEEKLTATVAQMLGDAVIRAVDRRGEFEPDPDPGLAGLPDGRVVNLRTGEIRQATDDGDRYALGRLGAVPETGEPELWLRSLEEMFAGQTEIIPWMQRWAGYCLTGYTRDHKFVLLHGPSGSGKSTLQRVLQRCSGTYYRGVSKRGMFGEHGDHAEHLYRLRGARLAIADDAPAHGWRSSEIKSLVSGETITARDMGAGSLDFDSQVKLVMSCNDLPEISDPGITRRIIPIEMSADIDQDDTRRRYQLTREIPRILGWAIEGAVEWYRDGLGSTSLIDSAVATFDQVGDRVGAWLDDCCEFGESYEEGTQALLSSYRDWASKSGERGTTFRRLSTYFSRLKPPREVWPKALRDGSKRGYGGIRLRYEPGPSRYGI